VVAAAEEERFTRKKHDNSFPINAINYCLKEGGISPENLHYVAFYEKPLIKFERILQSCVETYPFSLMQFYKAIPTWLNEKLRIKSTIKNKLGYKKEVLFVDHHDSHAASCFFVSPFKKAAIFTIDGVGEWKTAGMYAGDGNKIVPIKEIHFPHSLGLLYSTITAFLGFRVNNDEYKVMGLAPYGNPAFMKEFRKIIDIKDDGSFKLNMDYFAYRTKSRMWSDKLERELGNPREYGNKITKRHKDIAATLQKVTEEAYIKIANHLYETTKIKNLCIAGGVGLNSVSNGKLYDETPFENIFIQPAASDAGGALGAAMYAHTQILGGKRNFKMEHAYFGPGFTDKEVEEFLKTKGIRYEKLSKKDLSKKVARLVAKDKIVALFQGRMEWGPRALGNRSILANPINPDMKDIINKKVKHREPFRPFAPGVIAEDAHKYFVLPHKKLDSPYMLFVFDVKKSKRKRIPAVTHVDGTSRIQTVSRSTNKVYYDIIKEFGKLTGVPIVLNTSFNVRGEPIVCTPEDAYNCFVNTQIDYLVLNRFLINKEDVNG